MPDAWHHGHPAARGLRGSRSAPHRLPALLLAFALAPSAAAARDCEEDFTFREGTRQPTIEMFRCLRAEIEDLRARQDRLERALASQGRELGALPTRYANVDGRIEVEEGRPIGSASFALTSRRLGGAASLPLDPAVVAEVCAGPQGCSLTLTYRQAALLGDGVLASDKIGPCLFEVDPGDGRWILAAGCAGPEARTGVDGDGNALDPGSGAEEILAAGDGCRLTDADARRAPGGGTPLSADRAPGLYLIAEPAGGGGGGRQFTCTLELG